MYQIYKIEIGDYFYFGSTKSEKRLNEHKSDCYNLNRFTYNFKVYRKIRELCPNPLHFYSFVNYSIIHENLNKQIKKYMENFYINREKDNPYCLNDNKRVQQNGETRRNNHNEYKRERVICSECNKNFSRNYLREHIRRKH